MPKHRIAFAVLDDEETCSGIDGAYVLVTEPLDQEIAECIDIADDVARCEVKATRYYIRLKNGKPTFSRPYRN